MATTTRATYILPTPTPSYLLHHLRNIDLCVNGLLSNICTGGPLTLPPLATGVCPVQNTQIYTGGTFPPRSPQQPICSHLLQLSH
jgi:hypothetical protein